MGIASELLRKRRLFVKKASTTGAKWKGKKDGGGVGAVERKGGRKQ